MGIDLADRALILWLNIARMSFILGAALQERQELGALIICTTLGCNRKSCTCR